MIVYHVPVILLSIVISLVLTIVIECTAAFSMGIRYKKDLLLVCLVNLLTNPAVVLLYYLAASFLAIRHTFIVVLPLELLAIITEAYYYKKYGCIIKHPIRFSLFLNVLSYGIGAVINILF